MKSILIMMHCRSNVGYAIDRLEPLFLDVALTFTGGRFDRVHFSYKDLRNGRPRSLPEDAKNIIGFNPAERDASRLREIAQYIETNRIDTVLGFDQHVSSPCYKTLRNAGVSSFVSYWGAPMSSLNPWLMRSAKKIQWLLSRHGPDLYVFESKGMADTAVLGCGIPRSRTRVVPLGVDTCRFCPPDGANSYAHQQFQIPEERRLFFFSGHMEERKGIGVLMEAANRLAAAGRLDWHFLLVGNRDGEAEHYRAQLSSAASERVTFGGYRNDVADLHRSCYAGVIASTGWDSLTCSSLEMQASGLPLFVSDLPGLREAIVDGETGYVFPVGDAEALAAKLIRLLDLPADRDRVSEAARARIVAEYTIERQKEALISAMQVADKG